VWLRKIQELLQRIPRSPVGFSASRHTDTNRLKITQTDSSAVTAVTQMPDARAWPRELGECVAVD